MTKHEYFNKKYMDMLRDHARANPNDIRKNIGVVFDADYDTIWTGDFLNFPTCGVCGQKMLEGTIKNNDGKTGFPYWFCDTYKCNGNQRRVDRHKTEALVWAGQNTDESEINRICGIIGIPELYSSATYSDLKGVDTAPIIQSMKEKESMFFMGTTGTGKTLMACALLTDFGRFHPYHYKFIDSPGLFSRIQQSIGEEGYTQYIKELVSYPTLVIDDIGSTKNSEFRKDILFEIVNSRQNDKKQTVITTNLSLGEIKTVFDERLASRLSSFKQYRISGIDHRKK